MTEPPWDDLDDGIREVVRLLFSAGYETTDSGDGSKAGEMEGALPFRHVAVSTTLDRLLEDTRCVAALLGLHGILGWQVEGTLIVSTSPRPDSAVLIFASEMGVVDK